MHSILSFSQFGLEKLSAQPIVTDKLEKYLSRIESSGRRLLSLLNNLLDLSKLDAGKFPFNPSVQNLEQLIEASIDDMSGDLIDKDVSINFSRTTKQFEIECDSDQIIQVFRNLLSNAVKFSDAHSTIDITTEQQQEHVLLTVKDNGLGIPQGELETIFNKFVQSSKTNRGAGGTGLGLAICKEFIDLHKGNIWAKNNINKGASFFISLPISRSFD
jgi:signal transduction histidine kinase